MIAPIFKKNILFVKEDCPYCKIAKKAVNQINTLLPIHKQIKIIDFTDSYLYGNIQDLLLEKFEKYFDGFPTLFIQGSKKVGANSVLEYIAWLKVKFLNDLLIYKGNEYLPELEQYAMFDYKCSKKHGRNICGDE